MNINEIEQIKNISFNPNFISSSNADSSKPIFEEFYDAALNMFNTTNDYLIESNNLQLDLATGKTDDILAVMMAQKKASTSRTFTLQITNRIIEAYKEIMRTQI